MSDSGQLDFLKKSDRVGLGSGPNGLDGFFGSCQILLPLEIILKC
jgi:hypothetical protein